MGIGQKHAGIFYMATCVVKSYKLGDCEDSDTIL
jgi:hypothetical protein